MLEYGKWENFHKVIKQAINTCKNSNVDINVNGGQRRIIDYKLSRYACYLIV